ncbi:MAG: 16S rRNA (uracil(1498)-N(3))-methyltransferase [Clostridia bacterium]|nr:16S rRNA (uracil(1498)-N(3))-methyltransferase [Clostridia bacterium]
MHRFFADESGIQNGTAVLSAEDSRHALRVLRLEVGDEVELVCEPVRYQAGIASVQDGIVTVAIRGELRPTEARTQVTLYQGLPKADKMELIAQKTTELGVYAIRPVAMERCVVKLEGKDAQKKIERWQKIAREAVKQCARTAVPEVLEVKKLAQLKDEFAKLDVLIVPWEEARDGSIRAALGPYAGRQDLRVGILIGPEGGISEKEAQWLAENANAKLVTLGPRILRTETAGLASLTMVMACCGEME